MRRLEWTTDAPQIESTGIVNVKRRVRMSETYPGRGTGSEGRYGRRWR